jgi:hypothetical protein
MDEMIQKYINYFMVSKCINFLRGLFTREPIRLTIVRRYADANGSHVGELYLEHRLKLANGSHALGWQMVGASLDSLPLKDGAAYGKVDDFKLDTRNDFLAPMPPDTLRVGSLEPQDNDRVRRMIGKLPRRRVTLIIQNRFIEHVLDKRNA